MTDKEYLDRADKQLREGCGDIPDDPIRVVVDPGAPGGGQKL